MQFIGWEGIDWSAEGVIRNLDALDKANGWTIRTADGAPSAQWEIMVLVTEDGHEVLAY